MTGVDLFLGSDLGLWALEQTRGQGVARVITLDDATAEAARAMKIPVLAGNASRSDYEPAAVGFSVHYPRILSAELLARYRVVYNLHPGLLPWGKGYYPVFWALWDDTPAGPTLHVVNAGIDTGDIVDQTEVPHGPADTGGTLFDRVRVAERALFQKHWPAIRGGERLPSRPQPGGGSYHSKREFLELKSNPDWPAWPAAKFLKLLRCLTISQYPGWETTLDGQRFEVKLHRLDPPC